MKMLFRSYVKLVVMTTLWVMCVLLTTISTIYFGTIAFVVSIFIASIIVMPQVLEWKSIHEYIPDHLHMMEKHEYIIENADVYVKMPFGVWVETEYRAASMEEFIEKKIDYQHKQKETFKV